MEQTKDGKTRQTLLSDFHAPAKWRVNGPLADITEFYQAFAVEPGRRMWRPGEERITIW